MFRMTAPRKLINRDFPCKKYFFFVPDSIFSYWIESLVSIMNRNGLIFLIYYKWFFCYSFGWAMWINIAKEWTDVFSFQRHWMMFNRSLNTNQGKYRWSSNWMHIQTIQIYWIHDLGFKTLDKFVPCMVCHLKKWEIKSIFCWPLKNQIKTNRKIISRL